MPATCINQKILVSKGDHVKKGQLAAGWTLHGKSCASLRSDVGRNVVVAFMPWNGYNFEDGDSDQPRNRPKEDGTTSIHIMMEI